MTWSRASVMVRGHSPGWFVKNSLLGPANRAECVGGVVVLVHLHAAAAVVKVCRQIDRVKVIIRLWMLERLWAETCCHRLRAAPSHMPIPSDPRSRRRSFDRDEQNPGWPLHWPSWEGGCFVVTSKGSCSWTESHKMAPTSEMCTGTLHRFFSVHFSFSCIWIKHQKPLKAVLYQTVILKRCHKYTPFKQRWT